MSLKTDGRKTKTLWAAAALLALLVLATLSLLASRVGLFTPREPDIIINLAPTYAEEASAARHGAAARPGFLFAAVRPRYLSVDDDFWANSADFDLFSGFDAIKPGDGGSYILRLSNPTDGILSYRLYVRAELIVAGQSADNIAVPVRFRVDDGAWVRIGTRTGERLLLTEDAVAALQDRESVLQWEWQYEGSDELDTFLGAQDDARLVVTLYTEAESGGSPPTANRAAAAELSGRTAYSLTVFVEAGREYSIGGLHYIYMTNSGLYAFTGLAKGTDYTVYARIPATEAEQASVPTGAEYSTSAADAADIAEAFRRGGAETEHTVGGAAGDERASNDAVEVTVDSEGNYYITLRQDTAGTIQIPDDWGSVTLDLSGHTISGPAGTKPGDDGGAAIAFVSSGRRTEEGTRLSIVDTAGGGMIVGGAGADSDGAGGKAGDGGDGILTADGANARLSVGAGVTVIGGAGGEGRGENTDGSAGGAGIRGSVEVNHGAIEGGAGGRGAARGGAGGPGVVGTVDDLADGVIDGGAGGEGGYDFAAGTQSGGFADGRRGMKYVEANSVSLGGLLGWEWIPITVAAVGWMGWRVVVYPLARHRRFALGRKRNKGKQE